jgi:hypothetical protein
MPSVLCGLLFITSLIQFWLSMLHEVPFLQPDFSSYIHFHILFILKYRGRGRIRKYSLLMKSQTTGDKWPYYAPSYPIKSSLNPHNIRTVWRTLVFIWIGRGHPARTELCLAQLSIKKFDYTNIKVDSTGWAGSGAIMFQVDRQIGS